MKFPLVLNLACHVVVAVGRIELAQHGGQVGLGLIKLNTLSTANNEMLLQALRCSTTIVFI